MIKNLQVEMFNLPAFRTDLNDSFNANSTHKLEVDLGQCITRLRQIYELPDSLNYTILSDKELILIDIKAFKKSSEPDEIVKFARAVNLCTAHKVEIIYSDKREIINLQQIIPIVLPETYPNRLEGVRLIDLAFEYCFNKISSIHNISDTEKQLNDIEALISQMNLSSFIKLVNLQTSSLGTQLEITGPIKIIGEPTFLDFIEQASKLVKLDSIKIIPNPLSSIGTLKAYLNNNIPWQISYQKSTNTCCLLIEKSETPELDHNYITENFSLICEALGHKSEIRVLETTKDNFYLKSAQGYAANKSNPFTLSSELLENSNVVCFNCCFELGYYSKNYLKKYCSGNDNSKFKLFRQIETKLTLEEIEAFIKNTLRVLGFSNANFSAKDSIIRFSDSSKISNMENYIVLVESIEAFNFAQKTKIRIIKKTSEADIKNFFLFTMPQDQEWELKLETSCRLLVQKNEDLNPEIIRAFKICFNSTLIIERDPSPILGIKLKTICSSNRPTDMDEINLHINSIRNTLPVAFGINPMIVNVGNKIIIYNKVKNITEAYLNYYQERLYAVNVPVYVVDEFQSEETNDLSILNEILTHSLPEGSFLHEISGNQEIGIKAIVYNHNNCSQLETWIADHGRNSFPNFSFEIVNPSQILKELIENSPSSNFKKYFARVIKPCNAIISDSVEYNKIAKSLINVYFLDDKPVLNSDYLGLPIQYVAKTSIAIDPDRTKTHEDCFSIERTENGYLFGTHVTNVASVVPFGSTSEIQAHFRKLKIYYCDSTSSMLPESLNSKLSFAPNKERLAISVLREFDHNLKYISGSAKIVLAIVKDTKILKESAVNDSSSKQYANPDLNIIKKIIINNSKLISQYSNNLFKNTKDIKASPLVDTLLSMFNKFVEDHLKQKGIPLPSGVYGRVKFNSAIREFLTLIAQRQLVAYLTGEPILEAWQINLITNGASKHYDAEGLYNTIFRMHQKVHQKSADNDIRIELDENDAFFIG